MLDIPELKSERLTLRPWNVAQDADAIYAYASRPEATSYMIFDTHRSLADTRSYLANAATSPEHSYAITLSEGGLVIGGCGITPVMQHRRAEMGYIIHPDHWGKGYATEACRRLIQYGFEDLGLNRIYARADERNPASTRVQHKSGMKFEGTLREEMIIRGEAVSFVYCAVLLSEWRDQRRLAGEELHTSLTDII